VANDDLTAKLNSCENSEPYSTDHVGMTGVEPMASGIKTRPRCLLQHTAKRLPGRSYLQHYLWPTLCCLPRKRWQAGTGSGLGHAFRPTGQASDSGVATATTRESDQSSGAHVRMVYLPEGFRKRAADRILDTAQALNGTDCASAVTQTLDPRLQHPRILVSVSETALGPKCW